MNVIYVAIGTVGILIGLDYRNKWLDGKKETKRVKDIHEKFRKEIEEKKKK
jgi:hypothetical protein